jgi:hypothetical protein
MNAAASVAKTSDFVTAPFGTPVDEVMTIFRRDGGIVLEGALSSDEVRQVNDELDAYLYDYHTGSQGGDEIMREFWGKLTKRLTNVVVLSPTYRERFLSRPVLHDYMAAVFKGVSDSFWVQATQAIEIMPGEKAQPLHRDVGNYPVFRQLGPSAPEVTCNTLLALVDTDEACGATRVIPGSHAWDAEREYDVSMTVPAELKAGSIFFYSGKLVHGGGANRSRDVRRRVIATAFNAGFLVPEEAYPFTVPLELARTMPPRLQQALGFRSFHQRDPVGGSLWQHNYEELADFLGL